MSEIASVSFAEEIGRIAASLGRAPTREMVADLEARTRKTAFVDATAGRVVMNDGGDVTAFLARECNAFPLAANEAPASEWAKVTIGAYTSYRRADDGMARINASFEAAHDKRAADEIATWPNPWAAQHPNRTRQTIIGNKNPALAAKLKAQAAA